MAATMIDNDEAEWQAIEADSIRHGAAFGSSLLYYPPDAGKQWAGPKVSDRAHPESYGASLPMRSQLNTPSTLSSTRKEERAQLALRPLMLVQQPVTPELALECFSSFAQFMGKGVSKEVRDERLAPHMATIEKRRAAVRKRAPELSINIATRGA